MITRKLLLRQSRSTPPSCIVRNFSRTITTSEQTGASAWPATNPNTNGSNAQEESNQPMEPRRQTRAEEYENFIQSQRATSKLGTIPSHVYRPHILVNHPPTPQDITLELLMSSGAHLGHCTSLWNPGNARYIFGVRSGIHIISLEVIAAHLRRAAKVVSGVARAGGSIVFIGTRPGQSRCVINAARMSGGAHVFDWWIAGTITNAHHILLGKKVVERDMQDRVVERGKRAAGGRVVVVPDLVVLLNPIENSVALHECAIAGVPTVGIVDTDMDPLKVTYPIPCNDDSLRAVQLVAGILGRAGEEGRLARIREAEREALGGNLSSRAGGMPGYYD